MGSDRLNHWVQVAATIGVIIGIVLVVFELRQAKELSRAELFSGFFAELNQIGHSQLGENPSEILSKACVQPSELNEEELFVLDGYFSLWVNLAERTYLIDEAAEFGIQSEYVAKRLMRNIVHLEPGRAWLTTRGFEGPFLKKAITELLHETQDTSCVGWLEENFKMNL